MEPLMTSDEVAAFLRVDVVTIRRLVNRGELPAYRVGSEYRFTQSELQDYLRKQRIAGGEEVGNEPSVFMQLAGKMFPKGQSDRGRFDKFTKRARNVLSLAQEEARSFKHNYVGTEHLLLGLVREGEGVAAQVLSNLGVELNQVRDNVEAIIGRGDHEVVGEIGLTPRSKKVIELAVDEARHMNHHYIGTEHLLLGLMREDDGIAAGVLHGFGIELNEIRMQTKKVLKTRGVDTPAVRQEAESPLVEDEQGVVCSQCGTRCPEYFQYCYNCGQRLVSE